MKRFHSIAKESYGVRSYKDGRKRVDRYTLSYHDENGDEFRKALEVPVFTMTAEVMEQIPQAVP